MDNLPVFNLCVTGVPPVRAGVSGIRPIFGGFWRGCRRTFRMFYRRNGRNIPAFSPFLSNLSVFYRCSACADRCFRDYPNFRKILALLSAYFSDVLSPERAQYSGVLPPLPAFYRCSTCAERCFGIIAIFMRLCILSGAKKEVR